MKSKLIKKYVGQGSIFAFLEFFSHDSPKTLLYLITGNFERFVRRLYVYHLGNLVWWFGYVLCSIPTLSILCYSIDKLLQALFKKDLKKKQTYSKKMGLFFLKYTLVAISNLIICKVSLYINNEIRFNLLIMLSLSILFNYLVNWVIFLIRKKEIL